MVKYKVKETSIKESKGAVCETLVERVKLRKRTCNTELSTSLGQVMTEPSWKSQQRQQLRQKAKLAKLRAELQRRKPASGKVELQVFSPESTEDCTAEELMSTIHEEFGTSAEDFIMRPDDRLKLQEDISAVKLAKQPHEFKVAVQEEIKFSDEDEKELIEIRDTQEKLGIVADDLDSEADDKSGSDLYQAQGFKAVFEKLQVNAQGELKKSAEEELRLIADRLAESEARKISEAQLLTEAYNARSEFLLVFEEIRSDPLRWIKQALRDRAKLMEMIKLAN